MAEMVRTVEQGKLQESPYSRIFRTGVPSGVIELVPFGVAATPAIRKRVTATSDKREEGWIPFQGPGKDQPGKIRVPAGRMPDRHEPQSTDYRVPGVVGKISGGA
jgi:basic membrane protein A